MMEVAMEKSLVGPILRNERKAKGLTIEQVVSALSFETTTLSYLERGYQNVGDDKYTEYAEYLGLAEKLFGIVSKEKQKQQALKKRLAQIEAIARINPKKAMPYLAEIRDEILYENTSPLAPLVSFLQGVCKYSMREYAEAKPYFSKAIKLAGNIEKMKQENIVPACYNYLGAIAYYDQNDMTRALEYTQQGIDAFVPDGKRPKYYYLLLMNKPIYLEELDENEKALQATKDLGKQLTQLQVTDVLNHARPIIFVQMHEHYATIYNNLGLHEEALAHAFKGVHIAQSNDIYDHLFSLWTTIGKIYYSLGNAQEAKGYYQLALDMEESVEDGQALHFAYSNLSEMLLSEDDLETSRKFALKSVEASKNSPRKSLHIKALISLGRWHMKNQDFAEALNIFRSIEPTATNLKDKIRIIADISTCFNQLSDQDNFVQYTTKLHELIASQWEKVN
jgi:tetratricopeptide (TPR) repeat protein